MPISVIRLRNWFGVAALAVFIAVAGFYFYARIRAARAITELPQKLGVEIQQSAEGFALSKSEGGRTIFTVRASKAITYKKGGQAQLNDVNIIVYGRTADRFDQIYGKQFDYDPQTGNVTAAGEVQIDLQSDRSGGKREDQAPPQELKNPIHLKTSALVFNQKSGMAKTDQQVEFRVPQAFGTAGGAAYDSQAKTLTLDRDIRVQTTGNDAATITAGHGVITDEPRKAVFDNVHMKRASGTMEASQLTIFLRPDNSIERVVATGDVRSNATGTTKVELRAARAELLAGQKNDVRSATFSGGVTVAATGERTMNAEAGRVALDFAKGKQVRVVHAIDNVRITQPPSSPTKPNAQTLELAAAAVDFFVRGGRAVERAETIGPARITTLPQPGAQGQTAAKTTATADRFVASFNREGRIDRVRGAPNAKVVSAASGQAERVTTSREIDVMFDDSGAVANLVQQGNFEFHEQQPNGERSAFADKAVYVPQADTLRLTGAPRVVGGGMTTTARTVMLNRRSGTAEAQNDVKTTYNELKPNESGALLASADPIHVTAKNMVADRAGAQAKYSGEARLWQGPNIIQAPFITFDRNRRTMEAAGTSVQPVTTVLVQQDASGKVTPVNVRSQHFSYDDATSIARFEGGVIVRGGGGTVSAAKVDVYLKRGAQASAARGVTEPGTAAQLDKIVAETAVRVEQGARRANGDRLVYTPADDKYVLTGGPPVLSDPEHGTVTGTSLTFFRSDDRVLVEGGRSRTVTTTRVSK